MEPEEEQSKVHQWFQFFREVVDDAELIVELLECWGNKLSLLAPNQRTEALLRDAENDRQIKAEWERFWFTDQPANLTRDRIHGGIE